MSPLSALVTKPARVGHNRLITDRCQHVDVGSNHGTGPLDQISMKVLGATQVERSGVEVELRGPRPRLLLAILAVAAGQTVTFDRLIDDIYGDEPPPTARKSVQVHVSNLRRALGDGAIATAGEGYRLEFSRLSIDAVEFEREVELAASVSELDPAMASELLVTALGRWTGMPYGDLGHEPAISGECVRLVELRVRAAEMRIEADLRLGRHATVLAELEPLTADHPFSEELRALQMLALYRSGRQADALRVYARMRTLLVDELGIEPGPNLRSLEQQILAQSPALDPSPPAMATATQLAASGAPILSLGGLELRNRLGAGPSGVVHRAYQPAVGREVAVKIVRREIANEPGFVKCFETEAQRIARLEHPHVVPLHDFWRDPDGAYLVMRYLRGGSLRDSIGRGPLNSPGVLRIVDQIGAALAYAHRLGIAHGDLHPGNVLFDDAGNAYLSDFGMAVHGHGLGSDSPYLAPEWRSGGPIDPLMDQYSLGILLGEMLNGCTAAWRNEENDGCPPEVAIVLARACLARPADRFDGVDQLLRALRRAFGTDVLTADVRMPASEIRNPFKGLRAFTEVDAPDFHGRSGLIDELIDALRRQSVTVVAGPSGCGKSSVVRAGLLPAVRAGALGAHGDWLITEMFPGAHPFEELEAGLLRVAVDRPAGLLADLEHDEQGLLRVAKQILPDDSTSLLLVIDQFEELFSLVADEHVRALFLDSLVAVANDPLSRVRVVTTIRADFLDRPLRYPEFGEVLHDGLVPVAMPTSESLAEAIGRPVRAAGLELEPGLIVSIVADVVGQPGGLPLLQFALTELVDHRDGRILTMAAYQSSGGVAGAMARRAEQIYQDLGTTARHAARDFFLRLVALTADGDIARRRVRRSEVTAMAFGRAGMEMVVEEYGSFRLLSFDRDPVTRGPTVEVAHEALMEDWPRFREWIDDHREDLLLERRLEAAALEWGDGGREPSFLLRGGRFDQYREWAATTDLRLTELERAYLNASRELAGEMERDRRDSERRDAALRRRSRLLLASVVAAVVLVGLVAVVVMSRARAREEQRRAEEQAIVADEQRALALDGQREAEDQRSRAESLTNEVRLTRSAQTLVAASRGARDDDPKLAVTLAVAAMNETAELGTAEPQAVDALQFALQADGATFPTDTTTPIAMRPGPDGLQGVFVLPVADLVSVARGGHMRSLTDEECDRFLGSVDCGTNAVVEADLELAGGVEAYLEFTDPNAPLTGASVSLAGWYPIETFEVNAPSLDAAVEPTGLRIDYRQLDDIRRLSVEDMRGFDVVLYREPAWMSWAAEHEAIVELSFLDPVELEDRFGPMVASIGRAIGPDGASGVYGIPRVLTSLSSVFYRRDVFEDQGYDIPATYDELVALSDRIVADGLTPWCWAGRWIDGPVGGFPLTDWIEAMLLTGSGPEIYESWVRGDIAFDSGSVRDAFDRLGGLVFPDGYTAGGAAEVPAVDFWTPAFSITEQQPACLMTLATSTISEIVPANRRDLLGMFELPGPDGTTPALLIGGNHWSMAADTPENRAVIEAILSDAHAQVAMRAVGSFVSPDLGFEYSSSNNVYDLGEPSTLQFELGDLIHESIREGRAAWDGADRMPIDFSAGEFLTIPTAWFEEGPAALDQVLHELDAARVAANR